MRQSNWCMGWIERIQDVYWMSCMNNFQGAYFTETKLPTGNRLIRRWSWLQRTSIDYGWSDAGASLPPPSRLRRDGEKINTRLSYFLILRRCARYFLLLDLALVWVVVCTYLPNTLTAHATLKKLRECLNVCIARIGITRENWNCINLDSLIWAGAWIILLLSCLHPYQCRKSGCFNKKTTILFRDKCNWMF